MNDLETGDRFDDLDRNIVQTLNDRAGRVRPAADPVAGVRLGAARLRRRRAALALLPAAAVLATIGTVALAGRDTGQRVPATTHPSPPSTSPAQPLSSGSFLGDVLRLQAVTSPGVLQTMIGRSTPTGVPQCGIRILGRGAGGTKVYAWLLCADYTTGPDAKELTASSMPAVLTVSGTGAGVVLKSVQFPNQEHLDADIAKMFPASMIADIRSGQPRTRPTEGQLLAHARSLP